MKERNIYQCVHGIILKSFILALLGTFIMPFLKAQTAFDNIIPPSPTAASLMKFTDIPVSLFTGVPNIEIPLYEIKGRSINVPISLSYHGSGIKVSEEPGWTGLGWALNAGGSISRTIMGKADELEGGYIEFSKNFPNYTNYTSLELWAGDNLETLLDMAPDPNTPYSDISFDGEPDIFYFNFPGYSGKFVFSTDVDGNTTIQTIPQQNLKIIPVKKSGNQFFTSFEIFTEDGTQYIFGTIGDWNGCDYVERGDGVSLPMPSSWHLLEILTPEGGDKIQFTYSDPVETGHISGAEIYDIPNGNIDELCSSGGLIEDGWQTDHRWVRYLSKIETASEIVSFEKNSTTPTKLDRIDIKYKNNVLRSYVFNYESDLANRFWLMSVTESVNGATLPPYSFTYNDIALPSSYNSDAVDYWGYYNGQVGNQTKLPDFYFGAAYVKGGNLTPSATKVKAGSLKRITYPTGGYTDYEFEINRYGAITNWTNTKDQIEEVTTNVSVSASCGGNMEACCKGDGDLKTGSFTIETSQAVSINITITAQEMVGDNYVMVDAQLFEETTQTTLLLEPGTHTIKAHATCLSSADITVTYKNTTGEIYKYFLTGGLRIEKITTYDGISHANDLIKEYEYTRIEENDRSSGVLNTDLYVYNSDYCPTHNMAGGEVTCCYKRFTSYPVNEIGTMQGSHVVYPHVTVYEGGKKSDSDNGENGKNVYIFSYLPDNITLGFPFRPSINYDWKRGKLLEKFSYNAEGTLVRYEEMDYDRNESLFGTSRAMVLALKARFTKRSIRYPKTEGYYILKYQPYCISVGSALLSQKTSTVYDVDGGNPVTTIEDYTYSDFLLSSKTITNSDGSILKTQYIYPHDFSNVSTGFIGEMKTEHILSKPVEEYTIRNNNQIVKGVHTTYKTGTGVGLPDKVYKLEMSTSLIDGSTFYPSNYSGSYHLGSYYYPVVAYDSYSEGNLLQYHKEDDIDVSYLWGYNNTYPIAKAVNAKYSEVRLDNYEEEGYAKGFRSPYAHHMRSDDMSHSGKYSWKALSHSTYKLVRQDIGNEDLDINAKYIFSAWVYCDEFEPGGYVNMSIHLYDKNGTRTYTTPSINYDMSKKGTWQLLKAEIDLAAQGAETEGHITCMIKNYGPNSLGYPAYYDDARFCPVGAQMTTYTYDPLIGMSSASDNFGRVTKYVYDDFNRLEEVRDNEDFILEKYHYHYAK